MLKCLTTNLALCVVGYWATKKRLSSASKKKRIIIRHDLEVARIEHATFITYRFRLTHERVQNP